VVVDVVRPGGGPLWTDRDRQLAGTIAEVAESAIEKARLFEELKHQTLYDSLPGSPTRSSWRTA